VSDSESIADVFENVVESIFNSSDTLHYAPSGILYQRFVFVQCVAGLYIACDVDDVTKECSCPS